MRRTAMFLLAATWQAVAVAGVVGGTAGPGAAIDAEAGLTISGPWGDNMVLQSNHNYGQRAFMSGTAEPGSRIVIVAPMREDKGSDIETTADAQGYWKVTLEPVQASMATHNISISGTTPKGAVYPTQTAKGVRYGEVIICGGQSNMDRVVAYDLDNGTAEIAASTEYPNIFLWTQAGVRPVPLSDSTSGAEVLQHVSDQFETGSWLQASPATVANYSAVCYETARQLVDRRLTKHTPVGLVWTAVGGTPVQLWMPHETFATPGCDQTPNATLKDSSLFNNIIAPLANYSHRGVVWFQGEANVDGSSPRCVLSVC
jgi:sialate O-acetylesterase